MALEVKHESNPKSYLQIISVDLTREQPSNTPPHKEKHMMKIHYKLFDENKKQIAGGVHTTDYIPNVHNVYQLAYTELKKIPGYEDAKDI